MNSLIRNSLRTSAVRNILFSSSNNSSASNNVSRTLWSMCNRQHDSMMPFTVSKAQNPQNYSYGYSRKAHTKAEQELVQFLAEEIVAEKKAQKLKTIPTEINGFKVSLDGAEVNLEKKENDEVIRISFNINHTVDTDTEAEVNPQSDNVEMGEMKSKPTFTVDILRGNQTLGFTCSFNNEPGASGADESFNDIFGIDEITLYTGEHDDNVYAVAGEIIDGYLYDLLMNYLEEKGISNEFAEKIIDLSTNYEHTAYVSLLEGLAKFTAKK